MMKAWMVWRYLQSGNRFVTISSLFAVFGMMVGVASLVVSMSVVNGFEKAIHESVIDFTGHVLVLKRGHLNLTKEIVTEITDIAPETKHISPFVHLEALFAFKGKVHGVVMRGQARDSYASQRLEHRLTEGTWDFGDQETPKVILGQEFKNTQKVKVGDKVRIVVPKAVTVSSYEFKPVVKVFTVSGFIDLGKFDYNERIILTDSKWVQDLSDLTRTQYSGLLLQLTNKDIAIPKAIQLNARLGSQFYAKDWYQHNRNFLSAVTYEKYILFLVLSVMIVAACFNVSSSLFIAVLKRYNEIAILKSFGASKKFILQLFSIQGLMIGFFGTI
ncbi:MAG: ABC transporter permease, partial [Bdellovibrionales bacterium]|nr:ABC transporter permease [Bdellovibrionales bacterium]